MQLHASVMFTSKWSGSVVYAATETRENVTKPNNLFFILVLKVIILKTCGSSASVKNFLDTLAKIKNISQRLIEKT